MTDINNPLRVQSTMEITFNEEWDYARSICPGNAPETLAAQEAIVLEKLIDNVSRNFYSDYVIEDVARLTVFMARSKLDDQ